MTPRDPQGRVVSSLHDDVWAALGTVLDDLDRFDVTARLTDRGGDAAEGPGDVRELDAQEERHALTIVPACHGTGLLSAGWVSARP